MAKEADVKLRMSALDRMSKVIEKIRKKFPKLSHAVRRASRTFAVFSARTKKLRQRLSKIGKGLSNVGSKMTTRLTAPIGLAGAAILRTGVVFQKAINKVGAITGTIIGDKVTPEFQALEAQALELGKTTEFSSTQAAEAMALLGRAGFKTNEILASTDDVLALASASGMDLAFSADVMAKTIRQFGLNAEEATRVSDVLSDVSRRTNVDLETISETFKDAAPIAKQYGATLEQTAAITGLLGDVGIQGSKAGTTLKNIFLKLAAPSGKAAKMLKALGITLSNADGSMRSAGEILKELGPAISGLNKGKQLQVVNELFGLRGIAGASALMSKAIEEGRDPIANLTKTLEGSTGAAKEMQKIMLRGAPGAMARFQSALEGAGLAFAKSGLLDAFADVLESLTEMLSKLSKLSPQVLKTITIIAGLVAVLGPLLAALGFIVSGISKLIIVYKILKIAIVFLFVKLKLLTGVFLVLKVVGLVLLKVVALLASPFVLIGLAIAAVVAAVVRLIMKWGELVAAFKSGKGIFDSIKKFGKVFFGFGAEDKTEEQAKTKTGAGFGPALGAAPALAGRPVGTESINRTNNAAVAIELKGFPRGTKAKTKLEGDLDFNLGFSGGIQ
jgi:TP901 family phage tail tape measure protein